MKLFKIFLLKTILLFMFLISAINADEIPSYPYTTKEPTHYLIFKSDYKGKPIVLRRKPSLMAPVYKEVFIDESKYWDADTFRKFDNKKAPVPYKIAAAIDQKDEFFKVFFENEYFWVHGSDFKEVIGISRHFSNNDYYSKGFTVNYKKAQFFTRDQAPINARDIMKKFPKKLTYNTYYVFTIKKIERKNGKLWLLGNICGDGPSHDGDDKPCEDYVKDIYLKPFNDKGEVVGWTFKYP